jgi:hypothetical protein
MLKKDALGVGNRRNTEMSAFIKEIKQAISKELRY